MYWFCSYREMLVNLCIFRVAQEIFWGELTDFFRNVHMTCCVMLSLLILYIWTFVPRPSVAVSFEQGSRLIFSGCSLSLTFLLRTVEEIELNWTELIRLDVCLLCRLNDICVNSTRKSPSSRWNWKRTMRVSQRYWRNVSVTDVLLCTCEIRCLMVCCVESRCVLWLLICSQTMCQNYRHKQCTLLRWNQSTWIKRVWSKTCC